MSRPTYHPTADEERRISDLADSLALRQHLTPTSARRILTLIVSGKMPVEISRVAGVSSHIATRCLYAARRSGLVATPTTRADRDPDEVDAVVMTAAAQLERALIHRFDRSQIHRRIKDCQPELINAALRRLVDSGHLTPHAVLDSAKNEQREYSLTPHGAASLGIPTLDQLIGLSA